MRLAAPYRRWSAHRALVAARRSADEQLLASKLPSPRLAWRVAELTSQEHRVSLGRLLTDVVRNADERKLPNARPIDRGAVRECRAQLLDLASWLFDEERTVRPRGLLELEQLLEDGDGPLYSHNGVRRLRLDLKHIHDALDGTDL
jgi:hypothetical protein